MKIVVFEKEWDVNNPTYKEKRELWKLNTMTFDGDKLNQDNYFKLLERTEDISGLKPEDYVTKDDKKMTMSDIDSLLQQIFLNYMGLSDSSKKE